MKALGLLVGQVLYWLAWPAYRVYYWRGHGRTRVLLYAGDEIVAVKGWLNDGRWILPGGGLHQGEDPAAGALREVQEETGLSLQSADLRPLGQAEYRRAGLHFTYYAFAARIPRDTSFTLQRHEIAAIRWLHTADLTDKNASQEIFYCLSRRHPTSPGTTPPRKTLTSKGT